MAAAPKVPSRASPATAAMIPSGAAAATEVTRAANGPSRMLVTPEATPATQRRAGSAPASGPADRAAEMAARLIE